MNDYYLRADSTQARDMQKLENADDICQKIYIARNITLNEKRVIELLEAIDVLYREKGI